MRAIRTDPADPRGEVADDIWAVLLEKPLGRVRLDEVELPMRWRDDLGGAAVRQVAQEVRPQEAVGSGDQDPAAGKIDHV